MADLDELRTFLVERIRAFDSSIDTSVGSLADSEVITPLLSRIGPDAFSTPILEFLVRRAQTEFPDLVIQKGEPIYDLVFNMARLAVEPFRRQISQVRNSQSIASPELLTDTEADRLMGNFFASRKEGSFAIGTARLFFNNARFVTITPTQAVFTGDGLRFFPIENQSITAEEMIFNLSGSLYFFDIIVRAESQGDEYNIARETLIGIENSPGVVKVTNRSNFGEGSSREDTSSFFARVESGLSETSLVVPRGIRSRLSSLFETVQSIGVVGFGDVEMNRDILTGSPDAVYAFAQLTASASTSRLTLAAGTNLTTGVSGQTDFGAANVAVGDIFTHLDLATSTITNYTVGEVVSNFVVAVTPTPPTISPAEPFWLKSKSRGSLFISDIPGGIIEPQTPEGEIVINNNEVHIGGKTDIYVRAGAPSETTTTVSGIRDANPLTLGLDLQTYGGSSDEFVQIFEQASASATSSAAFTAPTNTTAEVIIPVYITADGTVPWNPSSEDVGRYLELLGPAGAGNINYGAFEITAVGGLEVISSNLYKRVTINLTNQWTGALDGSIANHSSVAAMPFRLLERVSVKSRVRDLNSPQANFGSAGLGTSIGDSVVIESGADAGVYTIRRLLSLLGSNDTLILDRELTTTVTPSGTGDSSGLRYRVDDVIQLDLVNPRNIRIPITGVFPGGDLNTVAGSATVTSTSTNFLLAGVSSGDVLDISTSTTAGAQASNAGQYTILSVLANQLVLDVGVPSTGFNLLFSIYEAFTGVERPLVRVKDIELLDSTNQPTGITIPYGRVIDARAKGAFSNRSQGSLREAFSGAVVSGSPLVTFRDTTVTDFALLGVTVGSRLEIYEGNNIGEYEISTVSGSDLTIIGASAGDKDFVSTDTDIHYRVGFTSAGIARLYFLEPTSVEITTGIAGGRLASTGTSQEFLYRFSTDDGYVVLPEAGALNQTINDLRVVRSYSIGGGAFETIVELTGTDRDVFNLEILPGDLLEVQEEIELVNSSGVRLIEATVGIFGSPAGLRTTTGSARVSIPANSVIDFTQMGDLAGQTLVISSGPDVGTYTIRRRIDAKTLELNSIMRTTTETTLGADTATSRDGSITQVSSDFYLVDATDVGQLPTAGNYITIFESTDPALEGSYEVLERDISNTRVRLSGISSTSGSNTFTWVATGPNTLSNTLSQAFRIYQTTPTIHRIKDVATVGPEVTVLQTGSISGSAPLTVLTGGAGELSSVTRGDRLEVVSGVNQGVYPIVSTTSNTATISSATPFPSADPSVSYRVRGGVHGSRTMLTLEGQSGTDGLLVPGTSMPYKVRRPGVIRVSSSDMQNNVEDGLYYVDVPIESLGPNDNRNLSRLDRLRVVSGLVIDGYTYSVTNNNFTFSPYEEVQLNFTRRVLPVGNSDAPQNRVEVGGKNLQITYENSPLVRTIDTFLRGDNRVLVADLIARHFLPSYVFLSMTYSGGSSPQTVGPEIEAFINGLGSLDILEISDVEAFLTRRGATSVTHPITLVTVTHDLNRALVVERSENSVGGTDAPYEGTGRISTYFANFGEEFTLTRQ